MSQAPPPSSGGAVVCEPAGASAHGWSVRDGVVRAVPVLVPLGAFGVAVGVMSRAAGLGVIEAVVLSATSFAGTAQFAALDLLVSGGLFAAVSAGALLNLRYLATGISVAPALDRGPVLLRVVQAQLSVDESWALSEVAPGKHDRSLLVGAGLAMYVVWVSTTLVGYLAGRHLDPELLGLDVAATTIFVGLLVPHLRLPGRWRSAAAGAATALLVTAVAGPGIGILAAAIVGIVAGRSR